MPVVAGDLEDPNKQQPLLSLEDRLRVVSLQYPIGGRDNIPLPKYLMNIFIYRQNQDGGVRDLALSSNLDEGRLASRAGTVDNVDFTGGVVKAAAVKVAEAGLDLVTRGGISQAVISVLGAGAAVVVSDLDPNRKTVKRPLAYVSLYMPESLTFTDQQNFQPLSLTDAMGLSGLLGQAGVFSAETAARLAEIGGLVNQGLSEATIFNQGYGLNPQLILLYKGPTHRQFVFQFKFVPRNADEGQAILDIIRTLRYHATPNFEVAPTSRYVIPPSEFEIEFLVREPDGSIRGNDKLPRLGQCVLTNVDVNYAPTGYFSAHKDGMATEIQMQLTFTEAILLTKSDISRLGY